MLNKINKIQKGASQMFVVPESNVTKAYLSFVVECSSLEQKTVYGVGCVLLSRCVDVGDCCIELLPFPMARIGLM